LPVGWQRIVNIGSDPLVAQSGLQDVARAGVNDIQMVDMVAVWRRFGQDQTGIRQKRAVLCGNRAAACVPGGQMPQFDRQDRRLKFIQARVETPCVAGVVFAFPAILPQPPNLLCQRLVVCGNRAAVAKSAEVLVG
jgi:putative intracellular protease/amidase